MYYRKKDIQINSKHIKNEVGLVTLKNEVGLDIKNETGLVTFKTRPVWSHQNANDKIVVI